MISFLEKYFDRNPSRYIDYLNIKHRLIQFKAGFSSDEEFITREHKRVTGNAPNLVTPTTFNEKLQWLKLYYCPPNYTVCADKFTVRKFVEDKIGSHVLNELYFDYSRVEDIDIESLPESFAMKVTHGSGQNLIVQNKSDVDWPVSLKLLQHYMNTNHYYEGREQAYKNITPRIICEKYLDDNGQPPDDYKFFCFNGKAKLVQLDLDRFSGHRRNMYDLNWELLPFTYKCENAPPDSPQPKRPQQLEKMIEYAEILAEEFPFARVDFYNIGEAIYFGEITFYPENAMGDFNPSKYDEILGSYLTLPPKTI